MDFERLASFQLDFTLDIHSFRYPQLDEVENRPECRVKNTDSVDDDGVGEVAC